MRTDLVESAWSMAVTMRGVLPGQVIFHADRGTQYTSGQLARFARRHNVAQSVGRTGVCWDNAQAESFWSTLKSEFYHHHTWRRKVLLGSRSATGSNGSTTADDGTRNSAWSAQSISRTATIRRHKPPDPVSTIRGRPQH